MSSRVHDWNLVFLLPVSYFQRFGFGFEDDSPCTQWSINGKKETQLVLDGNGYKSLLLLLVVEVLSLFLFSIARKVFES